jgi:hypothetical protein
LGFRSQQFKVVDAEGRMATESPIGNKVWRQNLRHSDYSSVMISLRIAIETACVRSFAPSFIKMFLTWIFTVSSAIESNSAMFRLLQPNLAHCDDKPDQHLCPGIYPGSIFGLSTFVL